MNLKSLNYFLKSFMYVLFINHLQFVQHDKLLLTFVSVLHDNFSQTKKISNFLKHAKHFLCASKSMFGFLCFCRSKLQQYKSHRFNFILSCESWNFVMILFVFILLAIFSVRSSYQSSKITKEVLNISGSGERWRQAEVQGCFDHKPNQQLLFISKGCKYIGRSCVLQQKMPKWIRDRETMLRSDLHTQLAWYPCWRKVRLLKSCTSIWAIFQQFK